MEVSEQISKFQEFVEINYLKELFENLRHGKNFLVIDFSELSKFDVELCEELLEEPEEVLKAFEMALKNLDLPEEIKAVNVRLKNLPEQQRILIRNIRSEHLGKLLWTEGVVRQKSDVRPQVTSARFECPSCGNVLPVLQLDKKFKEPSRCGCGRKGKFKLLSKELVDAQGLVLEETTKDLEGGEQPKRMNIFLKNDLVSPMSEKKTNPGNNIKIVGIIKEVPIILKTGGQSTKFDLLIEANYIESIEEDYTTIQLNKEDEEKIKVLSMDPKLFEKLGKSLAPGIYGHEMIKEALCLQFVGGTPKIRDDGVRNRGDIHILLIGDPGIGKSQLLKRASVVAPKARYVSGKGVSGAGLCVSPNSLILTNPNGIETIKNVIDERLTSPKEVAEGVWKQEDINDIKVLGLSNELKIHSQHPNAIWKLKSPKKMYELVLSSGKKIEITGNTQLLTIKGGQLVWKKSSVVKEKEYIATPRHLMQGLVEKKYMVDLFNSDPVVLEIKQFVKELTKKLSEKVGDIRRASKALGTEENNFYHNWVVDGARGNIKLRTLQEIAESVSMPWKEQIKKVSLYNGKPFLLPTYLDEEVLYLAGLIAGDGDIRKSGKTYSIRFSNSNAGLQEMFRKIIKEKFNLNLDIQKGCALRPEASRTHSKILAEILGSLGIPESPKSNRLMFSRHLLSLSNSKLSYYIAGLYDTDGSIAIRNTKGSDCIDYTTCSEKFARQLQLVLLRFGIHAKLRRRSPSQGKIKGKYDKWIVEIRGIENIKQFAKDIKLGHSEKTKKLRQLADRNIKGNTNVDIIPDITLRIKQILQRNKISLKKSGWRRNMSRDSIIQLLKKISNCKGTSDKDISEIQKIAVSDIFWEMVECKNVIPSSYEYVYDLTVHDSHNFIVDGVLVHNTAAVVRDEFLSGWSLEAGALVLANRGVIMIDELDKMSSGDRDAMHEGLEQQTISISKANIQATLRCETTVLAAANPKFGRFDPYETIAKQIDLPPTLINRFDLIFTIKDIPNPEKDKEMADFILNLHKSSGTEEVDIPTDLLRKYFVYCRQKLMPKLTDAANDELKEYYIKMRASGTLEERGMQSIPISARQLEALVRLAEASAKLRLSDKVTKKDARRAIKQLHYYLEQVGLDPETGKIDIDRISTGVTTSERSRIVIIREIINELEEKVGKVIPKEDIIESAREKGIEEEKADEIIERLKRTGDLFEPKHGKIQKI